MKTIIVTDYRYQAAGRAWNVPRLLLTVLPDGSHAISERRSSASNWLSAKSTLSKWRASGHIPKALYSIHLKKLFWFKLFGDHLGSHRLRSAAPDKRFDPTVRGPGCSAGRSRAGPRREPGRSWW